MPKPAAPAYTLRYDLTALRPGQTVLETWPELAADPAFALHGAGENDCWARFAIWYSDAGSPHRDLPLEDKRKACLEAAGVAAENSRRANVLQLNDEGVLAMITAYLEAQQWLEYGAVFCGREHLWSLVLGLLMPLPNDLSDEKTQKLIKTKNENLEFALKTVGELDRRWKTLWMQEEEIEAFAAQSALANTPTAERRAEGRSFIPSPRP